MANEEGVDVARLGPYLEAHVAGFRGLQNATKFDAGQSNPTYRLHARSGDYVLRRKPPGVLLKSAHAVDREFRVLTALADTPVPVPRALHLCCDDDVIGSMFYIMEYVPGRVLWDPRLPDASAAERATMYDAMNEVLAALHAIDIDAALLRDFGKPGNYFARQLARWTRQYRQSETATIAAMDRLIDGLGAALPDDDGQIALVHGDYRLDNLMFAPDGPHIIAVLDWELSTLGHPLADLAYQCMQWRLPQSGLMRGLAGVDRAALGIPTEDAYVARYCERRGLAPVEDWPFYVAFSFFRLAAILQGVLKRGLDGNASSSRALEVGQLVGPLAELGVATLDGESP